VAGAFDDASIDYANYMFRIGRVALSLAFTESAYEDLSAAHRVYVSRLDPMSIRLGESNHWMGKLHLAVGRTDEAEPFFQAALEIFDSSNPAMHERHIGVLVNWAAGLERHGSVDEATALYQAVGRLQEPLDTDLLPVVRVAPTYPMDALKKGITGFVEWQFTVDERGFVVDPQVIRLQGAESFEKASLAALMRFRYPPRFVDGKPAATTGVTSTISFMLED
jgi:TonB family protein